MVWQELGPTVGISEAGLDEDEIRFRRVVRELSTDAVGLAEDHLNEPGARLLTVRLIEQGYVQRLFLECNSNVQADLDRLVNRPPGTPGYEAEIVTFVTGAGPGYANPILLGDVAMVAVTRGIPIHFIDLDIRKKTLPDHVIARDAHAAGLFNTITAPTGRRGCVVLFGGHHLHQKDPTIFREGAKSLGELLSLGYITFRKDRRPGQQ